MTTDPTAIYDAIDAFQRTHRLPGLQHAQIRGLLAEHLARVLPAAAPAAVPPAADRAGELVSITPDPDRDGADVEAHRLALSTALGLGTGAPWDAIRERATELAAAEAAAFEVGLHSETSPKAASKGAVDRAAVLRDAAAAIEAEQAREEATEWAQQDELDPETEIAGGAVRAAAGLLHRMAAETPRAETDATILAELQQHLTDHTPSCNARTDHLMRRAAWALGAPRPAHVGGNAEDCPGCEGTNPPYPFICPGPDAAPAQPAKEA